MFQINDRVAIYCRLSKEDKDKILKDDDSESIQNQKLMLVEYAISKNFSIHKIFCDDDYSGLDKNRPAFNEMIKDAENKSFNIVLCKNQSRFTRDMELVEKYLHGHFIAWGIRFIGLVDNVDTFIMSNKKSRQINGLVNEWYCEDISLNVRAALNTKKQNGQYLGHFCTYGYKLNPTDHHKLIIDFDVSNIVVEIFNLYLDGHGVSSISDILTKKKYATPYTYKRSKGTNYFNPSCTYENSKWSQSTVRKILKDKTYIGHLVQGRERKISYKSDKVVKVPEEQWIIVINNHEPIISEDVFFKVQNLIGRKQEKIKNNIYISNVLSNKIKCSDCNSNLNISYGKNKIRYLKCAKKAKTKDCSWHTIRYDDLYNIVLEKIQKLLFNYLTEKNIEKINNTLKYNFNTKINNKNNDIIKLKLEENRIQNTLVNSYIDKSNNILTTENYILLQNTLNKNLCEIKSSLHILEKNKQTVSDNIPTYKVDDFIISQITHRLINDFIDYIEISETKNNIQQITIHWHGVYTNTGTGIRVK